jgi:hypothetical protein
VTNIYTGTDVSYGSDNGARTGIERRTQEVRSVCLFTRVSVCETTVLDYELAVVLIITLF